MKLHPGLATALGAVLLTVSCSTDHTTTDPRGSEASTTSSSTRRTLPTAESPVSPALPAFTPEVVTELWFTAYRTARWTDSGPAAWIDRARPYVTTAMHQRDTALRDGASGTDWTEFVTGRCVTNVYDVQAVVPAEAPNTATTVYVHVIGSVRTTCSRKPPTAPEEAFATLAVSNTPDGWRVDDRLY